MYHGNPEKNEIRNGPPLIPRLRIEIQMALESIATFESWIDRELADLEDRYNQFQTPRANRSYFDR